MLNNERDLVMEEKKNIRDKWLHLRLTKQEHEQITKNFSKTTERKLSIYARKILLGKPMIGSVRDVSLQEILSVLFRMQKDLNGIGNNYNQMLHKLHLLDSNPEFRIWIKQYEADKETLFEAIKIIKDYVQKTSGKWLQ